MTTVRCKRCDCTDATTWVEVTRHTAMCGPCWIATEPVPDEPEQPKAETKPTRRAVATFASRSLGLDEEPR